MKSGYRCLAAGFRQSTTAWGRCSVLRTRPNPSYPKEHCWGGQVIQLALPSPPTCAPVRDGRWVTTKTENGAVIFPGPILASIVQYFETGTWILFSASSFRRCPTPSRSGSSPTSRPWISLNARSRYLDQSMSSHTSSPLICAAVGTSTRCQTSS